MNERLRLAEAEASKGNLAGAMAYTQAAQAYAKTGAARQAANKIYNAYAGAALRGYDPSAMVPQGEQPGGGGGTDTGGGGGGDTTPTGPSAQDLYYQNLERQAREGARAFLRGLLEQYGLGSLAGRV